jgi:Asp-tRNA(Asn)/Glu-tRNA(Gln) amidotransferase A subunit family amidase
MARTALDLRLLFSAIAGHDTQDPFSAPVPLREPHTAGLKVGLMEQFYDVPVQPVMRDTVRKAATALQSMRIPVEPFRPAGFECAPNLWWFFFERLSAGSTRKLIAGREQDAHWTGTELLNMALEEPEPTVQEVLENLAARDRMRTALLRHMEEFRVLLLPACGVAAWPHRQRGWETGVKPIGLLDAMAPVTPFNLVGFPAVVIPYGMTADGIPVGIQLVGRPWEEELILDVAIQLEQARGPFASPPMAKA